MGMPTEMTDGQMDSWTDGQTNGQTDKTMDG